MNEFNGRKEFNLEIIPAIEKKNGAFSLWKTIQYIVNKAKKNNYDFFILCEDDHSFTKYYSKNQLIKQITLAQRLGADLMMGGVSWFNTGIEIRKNLFWVDQFNGLQFTVVFNSFYSAIISADFDKGDVPDLKLSEISEKKFVIHPYISLQKEFGYSDITYTNNGIGYVSSIFEKSSSSFDLLKKVKCYYEKTRSNYDRF
ncbi:glycosyl transferase [Albibacterium indicum]|uniref:glycosyl transferase n=1 Tax=Albibacterium indicum TaxID=2292082 RepID=UPI0013006A1D|nr:glycosyl transferase [Pedobacter indicus]